jgi:hypothetical protein
VRVGQASQLKQYEDSARDPLAPYGTDPVFNPSNTLFNPAAILGDSYNTSANSSDLNPLGAAYWYFPRSVKGLPEGFPIVMETPMSRRRASEVSCSACHLRHILQGKHGFLLF